MKTIYQIRYWLELIALPTFAYLVFHMTGHGANEIFNNGLESTNPLNFENFAGFFFLILFVWLWHRPFLKKWVPCAHTHCAGEQDKSITPHLIAVIALCLHFFPEAAVREVLWENLAKKEFFVGFVGFISHFFVDVIVAFLIASYWKNKTYQVLTFAFIAGFWLLAFKLGASFFDIIPGNIQGMIFLVGGFFLAMFVHLPHKPVSACGHNHKH